VPFPGQATHILEEEHSGGEEVTANKSTLLPYIGTKTSNGKALLLNERKQNNLHEGSEYLKNASGVARKLHLLNVIRENANLKASKLIDMELNHKRNTGLPVKFQGATSH
jgi:hypothetical protein